MWDVQTSMREILACMQSRRVDLNHYLSSGIIKGIVTFTLAKEILKCCGFLEGTTPMYDAYMMLKKCIADSI